MLDAQTAVYDYWLHQIQVMAGRLDAAPASAPRVIASTEAVRDNPPHPSRVAFDYRRRDFRDRWVQPASRADG
jgi:hypothetical protein